MDSRKMASGQVVIIALIFITVSAILVGSLLGRTAGFLRFGGNNLRTEQAVNLAEGGVDYAVAQLNENPNWTGIAETALGPGTFEVTVIEKNPPSPTSKIVTSKSYIPNKAEAIAKKTIKLDVEVATSGVSFEFNYAAQVGDGGLNMSSSATINGNVYSNGSITGTGGTITGDAFAVGTINSPPITVNGTKNPGASPQPMPTFDYNFWKTEATNGGTTTCSPTCTLNTNTTIGPQKYNGNLTISGSTVVTLNGPVYVTGNVTLQSSSEVKLAEAFGTNSTVFIADGTITLNSSSKFTPNSQNGYVFVVTTSPGSPGGGSPQNLGKDAGTPSFQTGMANRIFLARAQVPTSKVGDVTSGKLYLRQGSSACTTPCRVYMAVYGDTSGSPSTKKAVSTNFYDIANGSTLSWYDFTFPSFGVASGEYIWIGYYVDAPGTTGGSSTGVRMQQCYTCSGSNWGDYVSTSFNKYKTWGDYGTGLPDPIGTTTSGDQTAFFAYLIVTPPATPALSLTSSTSGTAFYALEGSTDLSSSIQIKFLITKLLKMTSSSSLTYETGLANPVLTTGPGGAWTVKRGTYKFSSN